MHSRADEVVPIKPTEEYVGAQIRAGNDQMTFVALEDLPHYETSAFAEPLKEAIPWVKGIWGQEKR